MLASLTTSKFRIRTHLSGVPGLQHRDKKYTVTTISPIITCNTLQFSWRVFFYPASRLGGGVGAETPISR